jgi:hypothetical protein
LSALVCTSRLDLAFAQPVRQFGLDDRPRLAHGVDLPRSSAMRASPVPE